MSSQEDNKLTILIPEENYRQFICKGTLDNVDYVRRIFSVTHITFQVINVILAGLITVLHHLDWRSARTIGSVLGYVHIITLTLFHFMQPQKTTVELLNMKGILKSFQATKTQMPSYILNDLMKINTWCVKHPLISATCDKELIKQTQETKFTAKADIIL